MTNDYAYSMELLRQFFEGTGKYIGLIIFASLIGIAARVFVCFAIYYDAKILSVKNRVLWIVLSAIFPICGFIYLCARNSLEKTAPRFCPLCGAMSPPGSRYCVNCHSGNLIDCKPEGSQPLEKKRKIFAIVGIVLVVLSFTVSHVASSRMSKQIIDNYNKYYNSENSNQLPDFGGNFGGEYGYDGDFEDDLDEFFDDFDNFGN